MDGGNTREEMLYLADRYKYCVPIMKSIVSWAARKHGSVAVSQRLSLALTVTLSFA